MAHYDAVFHVDKTDGSLEIAFANAVNYAAAFEKGTFSMVLVVNSKAVTLLATANSGIKNALEGALAVGLEVRVCNNALKANNVKADDLYPQCRVVPAGIVEIVDLQRKGYAYIKP